MELLISIFLIIVIGALKGRDRKPVTEDTDIKAFFPEHEQLQTTDEKPRGGITGGGYYDEQGIYRLPGLNG